MSSLYRPGFTRKDPKTGRKVRRKLKKWYIKYRDADGKVRCVPGYTDKAATQQLAAELEREAAQKTSGVIDHYTEQRKRPIAEHLADYERYLEGKGNTARHVKQTIGRIRKLLDGCHVAYIRDLSPSRVIEWLSEARRNGLAVQTSNFYLSLTKGFCRWLVKDKRTTENPLEHLSGMNVRTDRRHDRRALSDEHFSALLEAARAGEPFRGISGPDRAVLYALAAYTGLRASELASLSQSSFDLDSKPPTVTVEAGYSKRRREDVLPLKGDVASLLRQ